MDWFFLAVLAAISYSGQTLFSKYAARKDARPRQVAWASSLVMILAALAGMRGISGVSFDVFALLSGVAGSLFLVAKLNVFRSMPANISYPLVRLSNILIPIAAWLFLGEQASAFMVLGICFMSLGIFWLGDSMKSSRSPWLLFAIASSGLSGLFLKLASGDVNSFNVVLLTALPAAVLLFSRNLSKTELLLGAGLGLLTFLSRSLLVLSLVDGPASIVFPVLTSHLVIVYFASVPLFSEKFTPKGAAGAIAIAAATVIVRL